MLQQTRQWRVAAADEFLQLILADAIDQEAEDREVFPGGDQPAKRLQVTLLIGSTQDVGGVHADVASQARELAEMVDLLGGGAGYDQLVDLGRRGREHCVDVEMRTTDLAVSLDRQNPPQQVDVLGMLFSQLCLFDGVTE